MQNILPDAAVRSGLC